jgi:isoprenylcysteine carboxyl methyltransferase (ICMT) family protein YpbQ
MTKLFGNKIVSKERFGKTTKTFLSWYGIVHLILMIFALVLAFKCNKGFDFLSVMVAIFFPFIYLIYYAVRHNDVCYVCKFKVANK